MWLHTMSPIVPSTKKAPTEVGAFVNEDSRIVS